jgi:serine/threonine protein kinase
MAQGYKVKDKYELGPKIGEGMFGKVKEAVDEDGSRFAVKIIAKAAMVGRSNKEVENLQKEVAYMRALNGHKNVLRLIDIHEDSDNLYLVLELAKGGDLFDKIVGDGGFTEETACGYFNQVIDGLEYCHDKNIIHRDLKPENLLLGMQDVLKISDFGLSNAIVDQDTLLQTHCGSEKYAAPEIMGSSAEYKGAPIDIWSAGVILYIMTAGAFPFTEATARCDLFQSLANKKFEFPERMSPELKDLLLRMWDINPEQRIRIPEIRKHPWFNLGKEISMPECKGLDAMDEQQWERDVVGDDEEMPYRDLAGDCMAADDMFDDAFEEPVYRSIVAPGDSTPVSVNEECSKPAGNGWGLSIKPTAQFVSELPETDIAARLENWFMANGAECVTVGDEEECVVGTHVKVCFSPKPQGKLPLEVVFGLSTSESRTSITIRRTKGDCMHYIEAYRSIISPGIVACLE